jgi:peptidoglycan-associated lipoprotein
VAGRWIGRPWLPLGLIGLLLSAGCGGKRVTPKTPVAPPAPTLIALLPDPETHVTGRIRVSNEYGTTDVSTPRGSLRITAAAPPGPAKPLDEAEVSRLFGSAMSGLPPAPRHFTLQFKFESDTLTDESAAQIPAILQAVRALPVPEVMIIGHTDTTGERKSNVALGMKRAMRVRNILTDAGLASATLDVTSHGEGDLLVKTRDNVAEARNRRVDITVR